MYCIVEIQVWADKTMHPLTYTESTENAAWAKLYEVLRYAAISQNPVHSACILNETGSVLSGSQKTFVHYVPPPEPEEEPAEEE